MDSLEKENFDGFKMENFWEFWKEIFDSLKKNWQFEKKILTVLNGKFLTVWKGKFWQFGKRNFWQFWMEIFDSHVCHNVDRVKTFRICKKV